MLQGRAARRFPAVRGTGRVFQVLADLSGVKPSTGPTDLAAAVRHYAAQLTQRGPLMLISDLFDPNAERAISELAGTRCDVAILHTLSADEIDPPLEGEKNDPMMPLAWTKTYEAPQSKKKGRVFTTTAGAAVDLSYEGTSRLLVNASYWAVGLEEKITEKSSVELVGEYQPTMFKFKGYVPGKKPSDHAL